MDGAVPLLPETSPKSRRGRRGGRRSPRRGPRTRRRRCHLRLRHRSMKRERVEREREMGGVVEMDKDEPRIRMSRDERGGADERSQSGPPLWRLKLPWPNQQIKAALCRSDSDSEEKECRSCGVVAARKLNNQHNLFARETVELRAVYAEK
uniref:Uncharacterized protein n=1 Tax=Oryza glumipatula TaxID=40148 RepID=A0A0E0A6U7_9ORYZ